MYIIEDSYGAPQCGVEVIMLKEWYEVEEFLEKFPDVEERIWEGYAVIYQEG